MSIFEAALWNAAVAIPLAMVVWSLCRMIRRPAVAHALWIVVLLKLVTPPLLTVPIPIRFDVSTAAETSSDGAASDRISRSEQIGKGLGGHVAAAAPGRPATQSDAGWLGGVLSACLEGCQTVGRGVSMTTQWLGSRSIAAAIAACWLSGSLGWFALQAWRCIRFSRQVQCARGVSAELDDEFRRLAMRLGLTRRPRLLILPAVVSPMLWGFGRRTRIVLPEKLVAGMDRAGRTSLFAHELAHYCRGDHWTRVAEFVVLALFWWHPVAWLARREIEDSEEQCCDDWVLRRLPGEQRPYADALLDTIDFLCEARAVLVPVASRFGEGRQLKRRLVRIMEDRPAAELTWRPRVAISLAALAVLPVQPLAVSSPHRAVLAPPAFESRATVDVQTTAAMEFPSAMPAALHTEQSPQRTETPTIRSRRGERDLSIIVAPGGRFVLRKTTGYRTVLTELATGAETDLSSLNIAAISFLQDGDSFVSLEPGGANLRDTRSGRLLRTILPSAAALRTVAVAPADKLIALGGEGGLVSLVNLITGETLAELDNGDADVTCVRLSPDGRRLAVCSGEWWLRQSGRVTVWELDNRTSSRTLHFRNAPAACAFASGDELIVGRFDGSVELWNLQSGERVASARVDKNVVTAAAFSPDNSLLREITFESITN